MAGVGAAILGSYLTFAARMRAMERHGQTQTGAIEDLAVLLTGLAVVGGAGRRQRRIAQGRSTGY